MQTEKKSTPIHKTVRTTTEVSLWNDQFESCVDAAKRSATVIPRPVIEHMMHFIVMQRKINCNDPKDYENKVLSYADGRSKKK